MNSKSQNFDWQLFWLLEVIFLALPTLAAVILFRDGPYLSLHRTAVLAVVLAGLTVLNLILVLVRASLAVGFEMTTDLNALVEKFATRVSQPFERDHR